MSKAEQAHRKLGEELHQLEEALQDARHDAKQDARDDLPSVTIPVALSVLLPHPARTQRISGCAWQSRTLDLTSPQSFLCTFVIFVLPDSSIHLLSGRTAAANKDQVLYGSTTRLLQVCSPCRGRPLGVLPLRPSLRSWRQVSSGQKRHPSRASSNGQPSIRACMSGLPPFG